MAEQSSNSEPQYTGLPGTNEDVEMGRLRSVAEASPVEAAPNKFSRRDMNQVRWLSLMSRYGQETTMHGVRYIFDSSSLRCRRFMWLIVIALACTIFAMLVANKVRHLNANPKSVDLDFNYVSSVPFPAITICNESPYKLTLVHANGMYDLMVMDNGIIPSADEAVSDMNGNTESLSSLSSSSPSKYESYRLYTDVCRIPSDIVHRRILNNVSRAVCRAFCSGSHSDRCSGFLYSRRDQSCVLSPFTGETSTSFACSEEESIANGVEFYRRTRELEYATIQCTFEGGTFGNEMQSNWSRPEHWSIIKATPSRWETTLYTAGSGYYASMSVTNERPGYSARMMTPYMNTTNKCIELFYWIFMRGADGTRGGGMDWSDMSITIIAIDEQLRESNVSRSIGWDYVDFKRMFSRLPDGIHRIAIDGTRDSRRIASGISIDDVTIMECREFDLEKECLAHPKGLHYYGSRNTSKSGKPCLPWTEGPIHLVTALPDERTINARNYCRYVPGQSWIRPSCVVSAVGGNMQYVEECAVSYCGEVGDAGCRSGHSRTCADGMCLPDVASCTGVQYCTDGSTNEILCDGKTDLSCDFEDPYVCGYVATPVGDVSWVRTDTSVLADINMDGKTGHVMIAKSTGKFGDRIPFMSPLYHHLNKSSVLLFSYYIQRDNQRSGGRLEVVALTKQRAPIRSLFGANITDLQFNRWSRGEVLLPRINDLYVLFVAVLGGQLVSDVMIDDVTVEQVTHNSRQELTDEAGSWTRLGTKLPSSTFAYLTTASTIIISRTFATESEDNIGTMTGAGCGLSNYYSEDATFTSPGYPNSYPPSTKCSYYIHSPPESLITVRFTWFDLQEGSTCQFDSLDSSYTSHVFSGEGCTRLLFACIVGHFMSWTPIQCKPIGHKNEREVSTELLNPSGTGKICGHGLQRVLTYNCTRLSMNFSSDQAISTVFGGFSVNVKLHRLNRDVDEQWSLTIFQTSDMLYNDRHVDIYFDPDEVDFSRANCIHIEYASFQYFAIKLAFSTESRYNEVLLYRTFHRLEGQVRLWKTSVTPTITNGNKFYIVLQARSSMAGRLAIVKSLRVLPGNCGSSEPEESPLQTITLGSSGDTLEFRDVSIDRKRWYLPFISHVKEPFHTMRCEFEAGFDDDGEAVLTSSIIQPTKELMTITYHITSADIHIQLDLIVGDHVRKTYILTHDNGTFQYGNSLFDQAYSMKFRIIRVCSPKCSTDGYMDLKNVYTEPIDDDANRHRVSECSAGDRKWCGHQPKEGYSVIESLAKNLTWICRWRNKLDIVTPSSSVVHVKYDQEGSFNLTRSSELFRTVRDYTAYIIADGPSNLQLKFHGIESIEKISLTKVQNTSFTETSLKCCNQDPNETFFSETGIFYITLSTSSQIISFGHLQQISYTLSNEADTDTCNGAQVLSAYSDVSQIEESSETPIAEWASAVLSPPLTDDEQPGACFIYDVYVHDVRVTARMKFARLNDTRTELIEDLFTSYRHVRDYYDLTLADIAQYQIIVSFYASSLRADSPTAIANSLQVLPTKCSRKFDHLCRLDDAGHGSSVTCEMVDVSRSVARWQFQPPNTRHETTVKTNVTLSGRTCQRWDSLQPHLHPYRKVGPHNYCAKPDGSVNAWCYTTDNNRVTEYCNEMQPNETPPGAMLVQFGRKLQSSKLLMASFVVGDSSVPVVVHFRYSYFVSSTTVRLWLSIDPLGELGMAAEDEVGDRQELPVKGGISAAGPIINGCSTFSITRSGSYAAYLIADKIRFTTDPVSTGIEYVNIGSGSCPTLDGTESTDSSELQPRSLPENGYISYIYDEYNATDIENLSTSISQSQQHFIVEYGGAKCPDGAIQPIFTEMGRCYTFNNNATEQYNSIISGVDMGLWLTINLEQYDALDGYDEEAGIRISFHQPGEVGVTDYGLAVAPGVRALFELKYSESRSLSHPYGNCDDTQQLRYFEPDTVYSTAKCRLECQTDLLVEKCNCKEPYMPGPFVICNLRQHMTCVLSWRRSYSGSCGTSVQQVIHEPGTSLQVGIHDGILGVTQPTKFSTTSEDKANHNQSRCQCPPSCTNIEYDAAVSTSYLSGTVLKSILARDRVLGDINQRYNRSCSVRARVTVDGNMVKYTIRRLQRLGKQMRHLLEYINVNFVVDSTSIVEQLFQNIDAIVHRTVKEVRAFEGQMFDIATSKNGCGTKISEETRTFSNSANLAASLKPKDWQSFGETFIEFILPDFEKKYNNNVEVTPSQLKNAVLDMCGRGMPNRRSKAEFQLSTTLVLGDVRCEKQTFCSDFSQFTDDTDIMSEFLGKSLSQLRSSSALLRSSNTTYVIQRLLEESHEKSDIVAELNASNSALIHEYRNTLRHGNKKLYDLLSNSSNFDVQHCSVDIEKWLSELKAMKDIGFRRTSTAVTLARHQHITQLEREILLLDNLVTLYEESNITKAELATTFVKRAHKLGEVLDGGVLDMLKLFEDEFQTYSDISRGYVIDTLNEMMVNSKYVGVLCHAVKDTNRYKMAEKFARELFVWLKPIPKFQRPTTVAYSLERNDFKRFWSDYQTLAEFVDSGVSLNIIKTFVGGYFDRLPPVFDEVRMRILSMSTAGRLTLSDLTKAMIEYGESMPITGDYVRKNILKVKLFYGSIRNSTMSQSRAYDTFSLLGDLGGYLGLLIGGSALTIIEVVDLIFYNGLLKLLGQR